MAMDSSEVDARKGASRRKGGAKIKSVSKSTKYGLQFPFVRTERYLKKGKYA